MKKHDESKFNPMFGEAVKLDPTIGTPLFDQGALAPPRTLPVSQSQREAWAKIKGKLGVAQELVLATISAVGPCCARKVAQELEWEMHRVSGRMTELKQLGLIEPVLDQDGNHKREQFIFGGTTYHGEVWKARQDWRELLKLMR